MATVIDSLVLELGLDTSKMSQQSKDSLDKLRQFEDQARVSGNAIEAQTRRQSEIMQNFKREVISTLGLFVGGQGIKEFIGFVTNLDASTGRVSKTLNMSTAEVSTWQGALKSAGGTIEDANGALRGLSGAVNTALVTGNRQPIQILDNLNVGLFKQNGQLKTAAELWLDIGKAIEGTDPAQAAAKLAMVPGVNDSMINFLLLGRKAMLEKIEASRRAGAADAESAKAAQEFQEQLSLLQTASTNAGRAILQDLYPALTKIATVFRELIEMSPKTAGALGAAGALLGIGALGRGARRLIFGAGAAAAGPGMLTRAAGWAARTGGNPYVAGALAAYEVIKPTDANGDEASKPWDPVTNPGGKMPSSPSIAPAAPAAKSGAFKDDAEREAFIRAEARSQGIDPDQAVRVWTSEGRRAYVGDRGSSFGPFQLHYGGMAGGGMAATGLGDTFTKKTGLDARDPETEREQIKFSLAQARAGGWGPWHGWKGGAWAGIDRGGGQGGGNTTTVSIGTIQVNAPQAKDAAGIAKEIGPQLHRATQAASAEMGPH